MWVWTPPDAPPTVSSSSNAADAFGGSRAIAARASGDTSGVCCRLHAVSVSSFKTSRPERLRDGVPCCGDARTAHGDSCAATATRGGAEPAAPTSAAARCGDGPRTESESAPIRSAEGLNAQVSSAAASEEVPKEARRRVPAYETPSSTQLELGARLYP